MANVGGQAVLEGVMMRGPGNWAVAVRTPSGDIAQVSRPIDSAMARHFFFRVVALAFCEETHASSAPRTAASGASESARDFAGIVRRLRNFASN